MEVREQERIFNYSETIKKNKKSMFEIKETPIFCGNLRECDLDQEQKMIMNNI